MNTALHDFWFWAFWGVVLLLFGQDRVVAAYKRLAHGAIEEMEASTTLAEEVARKAATFPGRAEMQAEQARLEAMQREMCHDKRCPGRHTLKHRCHDLSCTKHEHVARAQ